MDPLVDGSNDYFYKYSEYKKLTQKKKRDHQVEILSEIQNSNDSTKMWKILQSNTNSQSHN